MPGPKYVRVKDPETGHEFDVTEESLLMRRGLVSRVKPNQYPPARYRRPAKHHLNLAAERPRDDVAASAGGETTTITEE